MSLDLLSRVDRELTAHSSKDVLAKSYALKNKFPHILSYPSIKRLHSEVSRAISNITGSVVLDYGCGRGESSLDYLARGAIVHGIDISPVYIEEARRQAAMAGFDESCCRFDVMDAHELSFSADTFDLVIGEGILHHLEPRLALAEIWRVLKPGGRLILKEPLADHPLLRIFRAMTPNARTIDESPFTGKDIKSIIRHEKWKQNLLFCGVIEAPMAMLTSIIFPQNPDNMLLFYADKIERLMHSRKYLLSWNQYVLIDLIKF